MCYSKISMMLWLCSATEEKVPTVSITILFWHCSDVVGSTYQNMLMYYRGYYLMLELRRWRQFVLTDTDFYFDVVGKSFSLQIPFEICRSSFPAKSTVSAIAQNEVLQFHRIARCVWMPLTWKFWCATYLDTRKCILSLEQTCDRWILKAIPHAEVQTSLFSAYCNSPFVSM